MPNHWWGDSDSEEEQSAQPRGHQEAVLALAKRRRTIAVATAALPEVRGRKRRMEDDSPFSWEGHVLRLTEDEFRRRLSCCGVPPSVLSKPIMSRSMAAGEGGEADSVDRA